MRKLGNATLVREEIYQMNTVSLIDSAWRDLKHGARLLRLNPAFALVAVLSLALGIGANTAIFQLLDAVRIRTLSLEEPWRLVDVRIEDGGHGRTGRFTGRAPQLTYPLLEQIRDRQEACSGLAAWGTATFNLTTRGEARYARGMWVNGDYFSTQEREPNLFLQMVVRSSAPLPAVTGGISAMAAANAPSAILDFETLNSKVRNSLMRERLMATLSGFFGLLAGLLATIGLYGVMSYMVERRRNEIGIRLALGADRNAVIRMILREAATLLGAGLLVGGLAAVGASRMAKTLLFGVKPGDPASLIMAAVALTLVAGVAGSVPAWRASRLEPTEALREE